MIQNPILRGFCPDPSIIRVGQDYYIATSTFEWWPGVRLFHSTDLIHWEQIPSPLRRTSQLNLVGDPPSGGVWAPCLSYDGTYFYLIYTDVKTKDKYYCNTHNYMVYTQDIQGEWSEPVYLNSIGFDPSIFHDTDGRKYLINMVNGFKGIFVQELVRKTEDTAQPSGHDRWQFIGKRKKVYSGSGLRCTEGPHMYHIGDWYYLITAEGGTGYNHCVTLARSKSVWGPFETAPGNPILTSDKETPNAMRNALQKCGHADITDTPDGEWYLVHLCARPINGQKWCTLGRETAIQKMRWNKDGWLELHNGAKYAALQSPAPAQPDMEPAQSDTQRSADIYEDFQTAQLPIYFSSPRISYETFTDLQTRPGFLRMRGQESMNSLHHVSLLAVRQQEACAIAETVLDFFPEYPEQLAGITYMYDAKNFYIFGKTLSENGEAILTLIKSDSGEIAEEIAPIPIGNMAGLALRIAISADGMQVQFYWNESRLKNDNLWKQAGGVYTTQIVTDEHCKGFTGAHIGMYVHDMTGAGCCADFDSFSVLYS